MRLREHVVTLLFIAAAIGLGIYAWMEREAPTDPERSLRAQNVLRVFRRDELTRIEVENGGARYVLERDPGDGGDTTWRMPEPGPHEVELAAVVAFLQVLEYASVVRKVDKEPPGFAPVRARAVLHMGSVRQVIELGGTAPSPEGAAYVRVEGEGFRVVSRDLANELLKPADAFRDRTIVPYLSTAIASLGVRGRAHGYKLDRLDEVSFAFSDDHVRVSRISIDRVWSALADLRADGFAPDSLGAEVEKDPEVTVSLQPMDASRPTAELLIGGACPGRPDTVVVRRRVPDPVTSCAPRTVLTGLTLPRSELVDHRLFASRPDEVEELELSASPSGARLDLARRGSGWTVRRKGTEARTLSGEEALAVNELATAVVEVEGRPVEAAVGARSFVPRLRVRVVRAESHREEVVEVGALEAGTARVRRRDGLHLEIDALARALLEPREGALKSHVLWAAPAEGRMVKRLESRCGGVDQTLVRGPGGFTFERPRGFPVDQAGVIDLLEALLRARAERWVADRDEGWLGASTCHLAVDVEGDGGVQRLGLEIGAAAPNGARFARVDGRPEVFTMLGGLTDRVSAPLVDRNAFFVEPHEISRVTLKRGARTVSVEAGADSGVLAAFGLLRADRVAHLGPPLPAEGLGPGALEVQLQIAGEAGASQRTFRFGPTVSDATGRRVHARVDGIDATYVFANDKVSAIVDAL